MSRIVTMESIQQVLRELGEMGILATRVTWPDQPIPDHDRYQPFVRGWATFSPWRKDPRIEEMWRRIRAREAVSLFADDRAWTLISAFQQTRELAGEVWEAGVYQGASAILLKLLIQEAQAAPAGEPTVLRLFDSFEGLPQIKHELDLHFGGEFGNSSLEQVVEMLGAEDWIDFRKGWIPATFDGLADTRIRLAHVDVDFYQSVLDCCEFIYPRLVPGGIMVFDDYGLPSCPGARAAVDEFFRGRPEFPFSLINGQCLVVRHCAAV